MVTIPRPKIPDLVAFSALAMIAFQIYWQYWFVNLMGAWVVNPLLPLAMLAILSLVFMWREHRYPNLRIALTGSWAFLALYLAWSTLSILVHEPDTQGVIHWLVDVWSAAAVFLLVHGLQNFRDPATVARSLKFLFCVGVLLSAYALFASYIHSPGSTVPPVLEWGDRDIRFFTGDRIRLTLPGLGSTHFAPMLLPLIFLGVYWVHQTTRAARYAFLIATGILAYCLFATGTRAALIPLIFGLIYLVLVRCIRGRAVAFAGCAIAALFLLNPGIGQRFTTLMPAFTDAGPRILWNIVKEPESAAKIDNSFLWQDHLVLSAQALGLASAQPILGLGMSRLIEVQSSTLNILYGGKSHNNYLSIAAGYGFPALLCYVLFIGSLAFYLRRAIGRLKVDSDLWRLGHTWVAILISYALYLNGAPAEFHFPWLWFALIAVWLRNYQLAQ